MDIQLSAEAIAAIPGDAVVVLTFDREDAAGPLSAGAQAANQATAGWLDELYQTGESKGKLFDMAILARPAGFAARRLVALGAGKRDKMGSADIRKLAAVAVRCLKVKAVKSIAFALDAEVATPANLAAAAEGAILGGFEPDRYKTDKDKGEQRIDSFTIVVPAIDPAFEAALEKGRALGESQNFTRELVNEPGNRLTPRMLASRAQQMAAELNLGCEILDQDRMRDLGMGAILGVSQGSVEPPALIVLRYTPENPSCADHLGLVGKGVTFDTGGISIKPADSMEKMKYDMAGGAAMLGAMRAIGKLKPRIAVTAVIPAVENMPGPAAQRPGDIVTTLSGKTVEVINTDAEGRLILADALEYARRAGCTHMVDAATLTGAIVVALGHVHVGVFTNDETMRARVMQAAKAEDEKMWPMPLDDDYKELLKNPFADLANVGPRWGGAISAAWFLKEFADPTPWVHLDIAGTAWVDEPKPFTSKGPSGVGVRTFTNLALSWV